MFIFKDDLETYKFVKQPVNFSFPHYFHTNISRAMISEKKNRNQIWFGIY